MKAPGSAGGWLLCDRGGLEPHVAVHQAIFGDVDVNALGFRDAPLDLPTLQRQGVLVAVGDSYTFGSGIADVADRYTDRLSVAMGAPVLNLGLPGRDFPSHATAGNKAIQVIRPRGIFLQFSMNDNAAYDRWQRLREPRALEPAWRLAEPGEAFVCWWHSTARARRGSRALGACRATRTG